MKYWNIIRQLIINRDKVCQNCFQEIKVSKRRHIHHKDRSGDWMNSYRSNNDLDNLILYCVSCHIKIHWRESWRKLYNDKEPEKDIFLDLDKQ